MRVVFVSVFVFFTFSTSANIDTREVEVHGYHAFTFSEIAVLAGFRKNGHRAYLDSLNTAIELDQAIDELGRNATPATLKAAREAYVAARIPYSYTEVLRFIFPPIDHWDKSVNAWPLDEGLIDYISADLEFSEDNPYANLNIIANEQPIVLGQTVDASQITPSLLREQLHELDSIESNVAIGYHAIEFLLWGQDLSGFKREPGNTAGQRPYTDFSTKRCTNGNCDRRFNYLKSVSTLLVENLQDMERAWREGGELTEQILFAEPIDMLKQIIEGSITFLNAELISERLKLPLRVQDPEHELDCFSDITHQTLYYNFMGLRMVFFSEYPNQPYESAQLLNLLPSYKENYNALYFAEEAMRAIKDSGDGVTGTDTEKALKFDQMLDPENDIGQELIKNAIKSLNQVSLRLLGASSNWRVSNTDAPAR